MSAQLGGHVSSSALSARAGEPVDSDGSIEWVKLHVGKTDKTYYWNRRCGATSWRAPPGVKVLWMGGKSDQSMVWNFNQVTGRTAHALPPLPPWVTGYGVRGLASLTPSWVPPGAWCASFSALDVPCDYAAQVPAVPRERGGASVSVPRQSALTSGCATEAFTCSANCALAGDSTVQFSSTLFTCPLLCVDRCRRWSRQCRKS